MKRNSIIMSFAIFVLLLPKVGYGQVVLSASAVEIEKDCSSVSLDGLYKQTSEWKKYKVLKACAWTSLTVGVCATTGGFVWGACNAMDYEEYGHRRSKAGWATVAGIGIGMTVASIPMFVCSRKNRKKALRLSAGMDSIQESLPNGAACSWPAVGIRLNF